jgi:hypothetical protein
MGARGLKLTAALIAAAAPAHAAGEAIELLGRGSQVYVCDGAAWKLKAPEAVLLDPSGKQVGTHFAGPSWRAADGSVVVGEPLVASPSPEAGSIPWLVLRAKSHEGEGRFAKVAFVVRTRTDGGAAPSTGCDAAHNGAEQNIPYVATYTFFPQP